MSKLTKDDLARQIAEQTEITLEQAHVVIDLTLSGVCESLLRGERVEIRNFGMLSVKMSKARMGRNPKNPSASIPIPAQPVVKFRPGKRFREQLAHRFGQAAKK